MHKVAGRELVDAIVLQKVAVNDRVPAAVELGGAIQDVIQHKQWHLTKTGQCIFGRAASSRGDQVGKLLVVRARPVHGRVRQRVARL